MALVAAPAIGLDISDPTDPTDFLPDDGAGDGSGSFFDLTAGATEVRIPAISVFSNAGVGNPYTIDVWIRTGTTVGNELSAVGWTLFESFSGIENNPDTPERLNFSVPLDIPAGQTRGFAVAGTVGGLQWYDTDAPQTYTGDGVTVTVSDGTFPAPFEAKGFDTLFADTNTLRSFAGSIHVPGPVMNLNTGLAQHQVVGSVAASPYFTSTDGVFTAVLVTNTLASDAVMHLHVIDGDQGSNWGEQDIYCGMTPNETTLVLFQNNGAGPRMKVECSDVGRALLGATDITDGQPGTVTNIPVAGDRGMLVITEVLVGDEGLTDLTQNRSISDWTTVDLANGTAISAGSLHFQGPLGGTTDGRIFLTGAFPAVLGADFVAPTPGGEVATEVLLVTLDGKPGTPPRQAVDGWVYNDDEIKQSWQTREWECMDYFALTDLDPSFVSNELCDASAPLGCVGQVVLNPIPISVGGSVHDAPFAPFGGAGSATFRQSLFDGWIIHRFNTGGPLFPAGGMALSGIDNQAATARLLNRGSTRNTPLPGDTFGLDLR